MSTGPLSASSSGSYYYQDLREPLLPPERPPTPDPHEEKNEVRVSASEDADIIYKPLDKVAQKPLSLSGLMKLYTECWNVNTAKFDMDGFDLDELIDTMDDYVDKFTRRQWDRETNFGIVMKMDLSPDPPPRIFVRADLHGDLKSLLENIRTLQDQGLLDEELRCAPEVYLILLGDYGDRGEQTLEILLFLFLLQLKNPDNVFLIRGNHEEPAIHAMYAGADSLFAIALQQKGFPELLRTCYECMPLSIYISVRGLGKREYLHFTHGLFEFADLSNLLDARGVRALMPVAKKRGLSTRIRSLAAMPDHPLHPFAARISKIFDEALPFLPDNLTLYNWGDVAQEGDETQLGPPGERKFKLSVSDIWHWQEITSVQGNKVALMICGHHHFYHTQAFRGANRVMVLPIGANCPPYVQYHQPDRAMIIHLAPKLVDSFEQTLFRNSHDDVTRRVTTKWPLILPDGFV